MVELDLIHGVRTGGSAGRLNYSHSADENYTVLTPFYLDSEYVTLFIQVISFFFSHFVQTEILFFISPTPFPQNIIWALFS